MADSAARDGPRCRTRSATVVRGSTLPNGLELRQVRVPFGVVGIIYEGATQRDRRRGRHLPQVRQRGAAARLVARPPAPTRPSWSVLRGALADAGLPADAIQLLDASDPRLGQGADARPRPGRRPDPARRGRR